MGVRLDLLATSLTVSIRVPAKDCWAQSCVGINGRARDLISFSCAGLPARSWKLTSLLSTGALELPLGGLGYLFLRLTGVGETIWKLLWTKTASGS